MADSGSSTFAAEKHKKPTSSSSSFFSSPRLFTNFTSKGGFHETETMMSPTSILDSKPFSGFKNPFWSETNSPSTPGGGEHKRYWDKLDSKGVGLGLVDALVDEEKHGEITSKPETRMVVFGSQLKVQIPPLPPATTLFPSESPKSRADFCIKAMDSQLGSSSGSLSHSPVGKSTSNSHRVFNGCLSASELELMELSEDYTRVISHGPNPRTTHIFGNYIIESSCFGAGCSASSAKENGSLADHTRYPSESFLSFCFHCKKNLGQGKDIYMYR